MSAARTYIVASGNRPVLTGRVGHDHLNATCAAPGGQAGYAHALVTVLRLDGPTRLACLVPTNE